MEKVCPSKSLRWCTTADRGTRALGVAGAQWRDAPEYRREYHVPVQAAVRGTTLGAEPGDSAYGSGGEVRGAQPYDAIGHARGRARGMIRGFLMDELFVIL